MRTGGGDSAKGVAPSDGEVHVRHLEREAGLFLAPVFLSKTGGKWAHLANRGRLLEADVQLQGACAGRLPLGIGFDFEPAVPRSQASTALNGTAAFTRTHQPE